MGHRSGLFFLEQFGCFLLSCFSSDSVDRFGTHSEFWGDVGGWAFGGGDGSVKLCTLFVQLGLRGAADSPDRLRIDVEKLGEPVCGGSAPEDGGFGVL